jgi:hypothetical protein
VTTFIGCGGVDKTQAVLTIWEGVGVSENTKKVCKFNEIERKTNILDTKISFKSCERVLIKFID